MKTAGVSSLRYVPVGELALAAALGVALAGGVGLLALRRGGSALALRWVARCLLAGAVLAMLTLTMSGVGVVGSNWVPGAGIRNELHNVNRELGLVNLVGNVVMFLPIGLLFPLATGVRVARSTGACAAISTSVELLQLLTARSLDVDDVLLNSLGGGLGASLGVALSMVLARRQGSSTVGGPVVTSTAHATTPAAG